MLRPILIILLLWPVISCHQSSLLSKEEQRSLADSVRQALHNYYNAINSSGLIAELPYLDSSDEFFWVPPGYSSPISYDSVIAFIKQNAPHFTKINNTWDSLRIIPLTTELVSYTGKIHSAMTDTSGKTSSYSLIETGLVIKRKNGWKLYNGQTAILTE